jgi:hypothetical protein
MFARAMRLALADLADFLEICRSMPETADDVIVTTAGHATPERAMTIQEMLERAYPRPDARPDHPMHGRSGPAAPMPDANVIRLFRWPPHCGQWFVRVGPPDGSDPRAIQYGPSGSRENPAEFLKRFAEYLVRREYEFDSSIGPPDAVPQP